MNTHAFRHFRGPKRGAHAAFTLIEIALSLTIIAFALLAIIGVLPHGMRVQKDNRQETIINQDAIYLMDILRSGTQGADDLTNYIASITIRSNTATEFSYVSPWLTRPDSVSDIQTLRLTNGFNIVGLISTPKYIGQLPIRSTNVITIYMRSISGNASDKPPQADPDIRDMAFSYRLTAEVAPYFSDTQGLANQQLAVAQNLQTNLYDLRLTFRWPLLPNGRVGSGKLSFRTMVSGNIFATNIDGRDLFFLRSSTFAQAQP